MVLTPKPAKAKRLSHRVTDDDLAMIDRLAVHMDRSAADVVRHLIRKEHAAVFDAIDKENGSARKPT